MQKKTRSILEELETLLTNNRIWKQFVFLEKSFYFSAKNVSFCTIGSQPGCLGTLWCHEIVSGVPPVITFIGILIYICI